MIFFETYYRWILAFHVISVLFWMAGVYYLPRLFVYHAEVLEKGEVGDLFLVMESKLLRIIMRPAMLASWIFAVMLVLRPSFFEGVGLWFYIKFACVVGLTGFHHYLSMQHKLFASGEQAHNSVFFRKINEIGPILTVIIVIMVIVRPF